MFSLAFEVRRICANKLVGGTPPGGQLYAGRPGKEATPAQQGVMRLPSGSSESGVEVRTVIQLASSQFFGGNVTVFSLEDPPAWSWITSPQAAASSAAWRLWPSVSKVTLPGDGVADESVKKHDCGSCAGPSMLPFGAITTLPGLQNALSD